MSGVVGSALQGFATFQQGRTDAKALNAQAGVAQSQALADEEQQRRESRLLLGEQAAAMAENGGGGDEALLRQNATLAELDALKIRYAGQMKAAGLRYEAKAVKRNSRLLAAAQIVTGVSSNAKRSRLAEA